MEETKKIEILFPEFCNLNGDLSNIKYLQKCMLKGNFIETSFNEEPVFATQNVDLIYMGATTEKTQEKIIQKLKPYKKRIEELIEKNVVFLITGNSIEIFEKYIENEDGTRIEGLGIFDIYSKRNMLNRHNSMFVGKYENTEIVGFKSQFTFSYGDNSNIFFSEAEKGIGLNPETKFEGIQKNNFIATYLIGPILILNPQFTKIILKKIGIENPKIAFEKDVEKAYEQRLKELKSL